MGASRWSLNVRKPCLQPRLRSQRRAPWAEAGRRGWRSDCTPPAPGKRGSGQPEQRPVDEGAAGLPSLEQPAPCRPPTSWPDPGLPAGQVPDRHPVRSGVAMPPPPRPNSSRDIRSPKAGGGWYCGARPGPQGWASLRSSREGSARKANTRWPGARLLFLEEAGGGGAARHQLTLRSQKPRGVLMRTPPRLLGNGQGEGRCGQHARPSSYLTPTWPSAERGGPPQQPEGPPPGLRGLAKQGCLLSRLPQRCPNHKLLQGRPLPPHACCPSSAQPCRAKVGGHARPPELHHRPPRSPKVALG